MKLWPKTVIGRVLLVTMLSLVVGAIMLVIFAAGRNDAGGTFWAALAASGLTAAAAFMVGALVGCLFGIPQSAPVLPEPSPRNVAGPTGWYRPSSQLQQVSDWLVKVLLGASLTQLGNVTRIGTYLQAFVGSAEGAMAIVTYFSIVGILSGYFVTVLYLAGLIRDAGNDLLGELGRIQVEYALYRSLYGSSAEQDRAAQNAKAYLEQQPEGSDEIFGNLALVFGQMFERKRRAGTSATDTELRELRRAAVEYASKAVQLNREEWGTAFRDVYDATVGSGDDDWAIFREDDNDPDDLVKDFVRTLRPQQSGCGGGADSGSSSSRDDQGV